MTSIYILRHSGWPSEVTQRSPSLCDPHGLQSMGFSRQEYWSELPFSSPGDLPDPGIEPGSPALQANSLPSEPRDAYFSGSWGVEGVTEAAHEAGHLYMCI